MSCGLYFACTYGRLSEARYWASQSLSTYQSPVSAALLPQNLRTCGAVHRFRPPSPFRLCPRGKLCLAAARPISPSPVTSHGPTPSGPIAANLPGNVSPPSKEVLAHPQPPGTPFFRIRIPEAGRTEGGNPPTVSPPGDVNMVPHQPSSESQVNPDARNGGDCRGNPKTFQIRGGLKRDAPSSRPFVGHREKGELPQPALWSPGMCLPS